MKYRSKIFFLSLSMVLLISSVGYAVESTSFSIGKAVLKLIFYTLIIVLVLIVTIYGTRFIAKNSKRFANSRYIQIVDTLNLGTNAKIVIMKTNNIVYILAITSNTIEFIDKFSEEEFNFEKVLDFEKQLDKYKDKYTYDNEYFSKFETKIKNVLNRTNKFIDKEDEDNEKKC